MIDGSSLCYRAFYAIRNLSTSRGQPTNAVYGVVVSMKKLMEEEKPEYVGVAFDLPGPTFRHVRFKGYKKHRPPMPEELVSQIPWIKEFFKAMRIPILEKEGMEADDVLGTVTLKARRQGLSVVLVTGDKDALQLLGPGVEVYRPTREGYEQVNEDSLKQSWNVSPHQVVDVMALMGDEVDAVPGVPGIGEKTAVALIQRFGSVEKLLAALRDPAAELRPRVAQALRESEEQLRLSRELVTLDTQVPLQLDFECFKRSPPDALSLRRIYQTLEFKSLVKELPNISPEGLVPIHEVTSEAALTQALDEIRRAGKVAVVVRKLSGPPELLCAWEHTSILRVSASFTMRILSCLAKEAGVLKICPNVKELFLLLMREGCATGENWTDPCLASYLLDPARPSHELRALAEEFLGEAMEGPQAALRLMPVLAGTIEESGMTTLLTQIEIPLSAVLAKMECRGIQVNAKELADISSQMLEGLAALTQEIHALAGEPFNINSPKQLAHILFEKLKLPVLRKTKTGFSTDEEVLRRLALAHPLPSKIVEYREMFKLRSTYVDALPQLIDPVTRRIHTSFNQMVTATGRLSSSHPNLQNIPIRTEWGKQIRKAFVPSEGKALFLAADYSQVELRILAHLSEDEHLVAAFREGRDIHRITAAEIFHVEPSAVSETQRSSAKTINFGIVYGMSPFGLAKELAISGPQAQEFIERYFARYPGVRRYLTDLLEETRQKGYCTTLFSRRRYIPEIRSKDPVLRQFAERTAINAPIQGSAADLIKVAMVNVDRAMEGQGLRSRMLLTVHDELIFEVPRRELAGMQALVGGIMESPTLSGQPIKLRVPLVVNLKTGRNWLEASHG